MASTERPLSPHLGIYRWQVQMVTSILHRATGIALVAGSILLLISLLALAAGPAAFAAVRDFCTSWIGIVLLVGWVWSLAFHLLNGIRHLLQDAGLGFRIEQFVRSSWLSVVGSLLLTILVWAFVLLPGGAS
ncbi:MAG: succinate dehydrogenase, cytochrome b556 subunit [Rhodanobacteraceae bacterium]